MTKKSNSLNNTSTNDIRAELDQIVSDTAEWMERAAALLVELRRRRENHPLMQSNVLRFFKLIDNRRLSAEAVLAVGGNRNLVRALEKLPLAEQVRVAKDQPVQVVEISPEGKEVIAQRSIGHLSQSALDRVFGPDGIRSIQEQREMLGAPPDRERVDGIIVDRSARKIIIGRKQFSPLELAGALKALGYEVRRVTE
jgi:hypothetical protein